MPTPITLRIGPLQFTGQFDDSPTGRALAARLPLRLRMSRWGDEYYGSIGRPLGVGEAPDARQELAVGEMAYWPPGNALCIFFGPTPASVGQEPRAASPVNPLGTFDGDVAALKGLGGSVEVTADRGTGAVVTPNASDQVGATGAESTGTTGGPASGWPPGVVEVRYPSDADGTLQPALYYDPGTPAPAPLLVGLHTWSSDYRQEMDAVYARWCIAKGWVMVHPDFRGPSRRPEAGGSETTMRDVLGAVDYATGHARVDPERIYLIGASGGGYMALLLAGRAPRRWAGVSAWVPVVDLAAWHGQSQRAGNGYYQDLQRVCGGPPGMSPAVDRQYQRRSVGTYLAQAAGVAVDINTGIHDGHTGSVPVSHALGAFNALAAAADRIPQPAIEDMVLRAAVPAALAYPGVDPLYVGHPVLLRRQSGNVRASVFEGGHEILAEAGLAWLGRQRRGRPAVWEPGADEAALLGPGDTRAGA